MRAVALVALAGCRQILGIEEGVVGMPPDDADVEDAAREAALNEAGTEMPSGCPGNYNALPNSGSRGHRYRLVSSSATWGGQRDGCAAMGAFLAFPDGPEAGMEMSAITTAFGATWLGVNDVTTEGTFVSSLGTTASAQTTALIGSNSQSNDCFFGTGSQLNDDACNNARPAVCECVP